MLADDISRHLFNRRMRYSGARMQQGRVLLDSDWNEAAMLEAEDRRLAIMETVCTGGSPNDGFRVDPASPKAATLNHYPDAGKVTAGAPNTYDFSLLAGSFYLAGLRFELDAAIQFLSQPDWPAIALGNGSNVPDAPAVRTDVVYVEGSENTVSSVEDEEFRERALGGPTTTTRLRRNYRIRVAPGAGATDCVAGAAAMRADIVSRLVQSPANADQWFDASRTTFVSQGRLKIAPKTGAPDTDPCKPASISGFIGAENQTIRVQQSAHGQFVWGFDDAGPLFRVQLDPADATRKRLIFITTPNDEASFPLSGQAIELLPWGAKLDNGCIAAEATGELFTIALDYNPSDRSLTLTTGIPKGWSDWLADQAVVPGADKYFYLRLWTGGPAQPYTVGTPVELVGTGLEATFTAAAADGDYWIAAARPNTPNILVPWALADGAAPAGPVRHAAALALIQWTASGATVVPTVTDCRDRFRSLCNIGSCCTVTVGDGEQSFGDTNDLASAVAMLPPEGGELCLLRGKHKGPLRLLNRHNVTVHGCGTGSEILPPSGGGAVVVIHGCHDIAIRSLAMDAPQNVAIEAREVVGLRLETLTLTARDTAAITVRTTIGLTLAQCAIHATQLPAPIASGATPLVFVQGKSLLIERNLITAAGKPTLNRALGGLQLGGASEDIIIRDNKISGGNGDGILLGSMHLVTTSIAADPRQLREFLGKQDHAAYVWQAAQTPLGCIDWWPVPRPPKGSGGKPTQVPVSDGPIWRLVVADNLIENMGGNGLSSIPMDFAIQVGKQVLGSPLGEVNDVLIEGNTIRNCVTLPIETIPAGLEDTLVRGGILLAKTENATIAANLVEGCATQHDGAMCGIFVALGIGVVVEDNTIRHNGMLRIEGNFLRNGLRGGIYLLLALQRVQDKAAQPLQLDITAPAAAFIHRNRVSTTSARALTVLAAGPVQVDDNDFGVLGVDAAAIALERGDGAEFLGPADQHLAAQTQALDTRQAAQQSAANSAMIARTRYQAAFVTTLQGDNPSLPALPLLFDLVGATSVFVFDLVARQPVQSDQSTSTVNGLPASAPASNPVDGIWTNAFGSIAFNDNAVAMNMPVFPVVGGNRSFASNSFTQLGAPSVNVALVSLDDVGSDSNRFAWMSTLSATANLFTAAPTVRATANRLQEPLIRTVSMLSALTVGEFANATALNQADHCIADLILNSGFDTTGRPHIGGLVGAIPTLYLNAQHVQAIDGETSCGGDNIDKARAQYQGFVWLFWVIEVLGVVYARYQLSSWSTAQTLTGLMNGFNSSATATSTSTSTAHQTSAS